MKGTTHLFAGAATAALINPNPEFIATAAVAALLPDIDHPNSKAKPAYDTWATPGMSHLTLYATRSVKRWWTLGVSLDRVASLATAICRRQSGTLRLRNMTCR